MSFENDPASERTDDHPAIDPQQLGALGVGAFHIGLNAKGEKLVDTLSPLGQVALPTEGAAAKWLKEQDELKARQERKKLN